MRYSCACSALPEPAQPTRQPPRRVGRRTRALRHAALHGAAADHGPEGVTGRAKRTARACTGGIHAPAGHGGLEPDLDPDGARADSFPRGRRLLSRLWAPPRQQWGWKGTFKACEAREAVYVHLPPDRHQLILKRHGVCEAGAVAVGATPWRISLSPRKCSTYAQRSGGSWGAATSSPPTSTQVSPAASRRSTRSTTHARASCRAVFFLSSSSPRHHHGE